MRTARTDAWGTVERLCKGFGLTDPNVPGNPYWKNRVKEQLEVMQEGNSFSAAQVYMLQGLLYNALSLALGLDPSKPASKMEKEASDKVAMINGSYLKDEWQRITMADEAFM